MAGTVKGSINHQVSNSGADGNRDVFVVLYNFFQQLVTAGYCTEIANHYGSGASGFDLTGGSNPAGENAFAVFSFDTSTTRPGGGSELGAYHVLIQWADADAFGTSPGDPAKLNAATLDGVGIAVAFAEDGSSPWGGGTAKAGADSKSDPVWSGGATTHVFPLSNNTGGSHATSRENLLQVVDATAANTRINCIADEDQFVILTSASASLAYSGLHCLLYEPQDHTPCSYPLFVMKRLTAGGHSANAAYGITSGLENPNGGGCMTPDIDGVVEPAMFWDASDLLDAGHNPNPFSTGGLVFDEQAMKIGAYDSTSGKYGWAGQHGDFWRQCYGTPSEGVNVALDRSSWGSDNSTTIKDTYPWGSAEAPGASRTLAGVQF